MRLNEKVQCMSLGLKCRPVLYHAPNMGARYRGCHITPRAVIPSRVSRETARYPRGYRGMVPLVPFFSPFFGFFFVRTLRSPPPAAALSLPLSLSLFLRVVLIYFFGGFFFSFEDLFIYFFGRLLCLIRFFFF